MDRDGEDEKAEKQAIFQAMKYVSLSPNKHWNDWNFSNILPITKIDASTLKFGQEDFKFGLCVQPTFEYDKVFEFIQWIEFNKMMGVSHFTFYNVSIGPRVSCVMRSRVATKGEYKTNLTQVAQKFVIFVKMSCSIC